MFEGAGSPVPTSTKRQQEVLERLEGGVPVKGIAADLGVSRNAVYQVIERLRRDGVLPADFTPSGRPAHGTVVATLPIGRVEGAATSSPARGSSIAALRELDSEDEQYAALLAEAIERRDIPALAYELGRAEAGGRSELTKGMLRSALARLVDL